MDELLIDDTDTASEEELAQYTWTPEDEAKLAAIIEAAFQSKEEQ